jgi:hypothetical protein
LSQAAEQAAIRGKLDLSLLPGSAAIFLDDVREHSLRFFDQITVLDAIGQKCPAVDLPPTGPSPIDIRRTVPSTVPQTLGTIQSIQRATLVSLLQTAQQVAHQAGFKVLSIKSAHARGAFSALMTEFLVQRVESSGGVLSGGSAGGGYPGSAVTPGLNVIVKTQGYNLRILYSPAFFVSLQTAFGNSLSTPVSGNISPGTFIFGAQTKGRPAVFENTQYPIPPITVVNMLTV